MKVKAEAEAEADHHIICPSRPFRPSATSTFTASKRGFIQPSTLISVCRAMRHDTILCTRNAIYMQIGDPRPVPSPSPFPLSVGGCQCMSRVAMRRNLPSPPNLPLSLPKAYQIPVHPDWCEMLHASLDRTGTALFSGRTML